jgi:hypothetical protein
MRRHWILYPLVAAIYPIVAIYARNAEGVPVSQLVWPLALLTLAAILVFSIARLVVRDSARAGLVTVVAFVFFHTAALLPDFVDESLYYLSRFWVMTDFHVSRPLVVGIELLAAIAVCWVVLKACKSPAMLTPYLNVFALVLIAMPTVAAVRIVAREPARAERPEDRFSFADRANAQSGQLAADPAVKPPGEVKTIAADHERPDIYYIILDGYARTDVMRELFGFDNRPFLERLRKRGFYVADQSTANYCQTPLSLSSSMNGVYLNDRIPPTARDKSQLSRWIGDGTVVRTLRGLGYRFVTFATGFEETEQPHADVYLSPSPYISAFHRMIINRTPLVWAVPGEQHRDEFDFMRERTLFLLDQVPRLAREEQPTFTFAHILSPHPPFVFGENGEDVSPHGRLCQLTDGDHYREIYGDRHTYATGYRNQAAFITARVESMIDRILANSRRPPVIILQSDHGSGLNLSTNSVEQTDLHERMSILNAYYLPGAEKPALYPSISPVNSFRVVFNAYFKAGLELLPDRSYYSTWDDPFLFTDVSPRVRSEQSTGARFATTASRSNLAGASYRPEPGPGDFD